MTVNYSDNSFSLGGNAKAFRPRNLNNSRPSFSDSDGMYEFLAALQNIVEEEEGSQAAEQWFENVLDYLEDFGVLYDEEEGW